jgi:hypothetical protein
VNDVQTFATDSDDNDDPTHDYELTEAHPSSLVLDAGSGIVAKGCGKRERHGIHPADDREAEIEDERPAKGNTVRLTAGLSGN